MSIESDILHEIDFAAIIKDFAVVIEKGVWPLNVDCVGRYSHGGIWRRDGGHAFLTIDFGVLLTGIESVIIHGWDAFNPHHWNELCPSVSHRVITSCYSTDNNRAALLAIFSVLNQGLALNICSYLHTSLNTWAWLILCRPYNIFTYCLAEQNLTNVIKAIHIISFVCHSPMSLVYWVVIWHSWVNFFFSSNLLELPRKTIINNRFIIDDETIIYYDKKF